MVGKRHRVANTNGNTKQPHEDIETGKLRPTAARFRDAAHITLSDRRRDELKRKLKEGIDRDWCSEYRKDPEEVNIIPC